MSITQGICIIVTISGLYLKSIHLLAAIKGKDKSRIKAELFFMSLIILLGVALIILTGKP